MKILAIADRPPKESIKTTLSQNKIDLIITLGDLSQFDVSELEGVTDIPKIGVYGNHDSGTYFEPLGIKNIHLKTFEYDGVIFGGFEGSVRYKDNPDAIMYTQEEASFLLQDFPKVDVMITHCPPYEVNDEPGELSHEGFKALREYMEKHSPSFLLHGHTYPSDETMINKVVNTQIIYVYQDKIIDLEFS